ncbi:conserved Plasmodium protein, unknown function [Plasmodium yoelii]|uniref:Cell division control protein 6 n=2 Tax=Plasmodium yoelii TaxID=5861 RepID=A0AAF0B117_PLAYO|nr:conserved Plasmodium protein, unknown function [Plasmodium yoelii]WBY58407.1 cell division control protein 6 [Plasmodium yoelii yoelii]CDU18734.1 conserved Plasmodium protein, unknown function [Plasmodium yoelii]VTZ79319.1 conserved Plasmodium protein, unknown function [Plasmodium yoelii]|eukprot:XP_727342.2 conserved Plasmodium protein, unknown function [Plasmodium yoelii]
MKTNNNTTHPHKIKTSNVKTMINHSKNKNTENKIIEIIRKNGDTNTNKNMYNTKLVKNGLAKCEDELIDTNTVEENINHIEKSMNKLNEIENKIIDNINECNKFIDFYERSKSLLDSKDFDSDVGREQEIEQIRKVIKRCSTNLTSEGIFLTGPSGQGKTYSIFYIIKEIEKEKQEMNNYNNNKKNKKENTIIPNYKNIDSSYFYVSCSNSQKPYDIFADILQQIINNKNKKIILNTVKQKYNLNGLEEVKKLFINYTSKFNNLKIVIVDELDFIATKNVRTELKTKNNTKNSNEDIVKALFECVQNSKCKIILVGIANSLDLIKDYTHMKINQIIYKPYNEHQFMHIIRNKLNTLEDELINKIFKGVSLNIHLRQISNQNGDIRSCFDAILRVFSDKKSDLEDRKKNLIKLKEEIMMNKIFNKKEKRNLFLLINDKSNVDSDDQLTLASDNDNPNYSEYSNELESSIRKKRKRDIDNILIDDEIEKKVKKNGKKELTPNKKKNTYENSVASFENSDMDNDFYLNQNITPLPKMENIHDKFRDNTKNLRFTDLKNECEIGYETLRKEAIKMNNNNETMSEILIRKNFKTNDDNNYFCYDNESSPKRYYESPFKVLYKDEEKYDESINFKNKKDILRNINIQKLSSFDTIIDNQLKNLEKKFQDFTTINNTVMISDIKKVTDKIPLEEHKDILFKIKSLPLIQKLCLYSSCNLINDTHLNIDDKNEEDRDYNNKLQNIEITYSDIQNGFRNLCNNLSETAYIKDLLEGNTIDQSIEHFEELGILTNCKKNQKIKEKKSIIKVPKGLTPRFANIQKNNKSFSSQNKLNSTYYFNLPISVIKQTLQEISSILSSFDKSV